MIIQIQQFKISFSIQKFETIYPLFLMRSQTHIHGDSFNQQYMTKSTSRPSQTLQTQVPHNVDYQQVTGGSSLNHRGEEELRDSVQEEHEQQTMGVDSMCGIIQLQQQNRIIEDINATLLWKLEEKEKDLHSYKQAVKVKDQKLQDKENKIKELERKIKKQDVDHANQRRSANFNEHENKMLREQLTAFKAKCTSLEEQVNQANHQLHNNVELHAEIQEVHERAKAQEREHSLQLNVEKDKYQELLHKYTDLQTEEQSLRVSYDALSQECQTIRSFSEIQTSQIETLQAEISKMVGMLEEIKVNYEQELAERDARMVAAESGAVQQLKQMQHMMRQEQIEAQKEVMKLREEIRWRDRQEQQRREKEAYESAAREGLVATTPALGAQASRSQVSRSGTGMGTIDTEKVDMHRQFVEHEARQVAMMEPMLEPRQMTGPMVEEPTVELESLGKSHEGGLTYSDTRLFSKNARQTLDSARVSQSEAKTDRGETYRTDLEESMTDDVGRKKTNRSQSADRCGGRDSQRVFHTLDYAMALANPDESTMQGLLVQSPLINWLRQQLYGSWAQEKMIKDCVRQLANRCLKDIVKRTKMLKQQEGAVRAEVEMWQMRNEEMETRLYNLNMRMWSLKQICQEQQQQLKRYSVERHDFLQLMQKCREAGEYHILQSKSYYYDLYAQMKNSDSYHQIYRNMQDAKDNIVDTDEDRRNLQEQLEQLSDITELRKQEIESLTEKNQILQGQIQEMQQADQTSHGRQFQMLQQIFNTIDPETSEALFEPSIEQLSKLIVSKLNTFLVKKHVKRDEIEVIEERHRYEMKQQTQKIQQMESTIKCMQQEDYQLEHKGSKKAKSMKQENEALIQQLQNLSTENINLKIDLQQHENTIQQMENQLNQLQQSLVEGPALSSQNKDQDQSLDDPYCLNPGAPTNFQRLNARTVADSALTDKQSSQNNITNAQNPHQQLYPQTITDSAVNNSNIINGEGNYDDRRLALDSKLNRHQQQYRNPSKDVIETSEWNRPTSNSQDEEFGDSPEIVSGNLQEQTKRKGFQPTNQYLPTFYNNYDETSRNLFNEFPEGSSMRDMHLAGTNFSKEPPIEVAHLQGQSQGGSFENQGGSFDNRQTMNLNQHPYAKSLQGSQQKFVNSENNMYQNHDHKDTQQFLSFNTNRGSSHVVNNDENQYDTQAMNVFNTQQQVADGMDMTRNSNLMFSQDDDKMLQQLQSIKGDILDALNELKQKDQIWHLTDTQKGQCDDVIKTMVINTNQSNPFSHAFDLVRSLFEVLRSVMTQQNEQSMRLSASIDPSSLTSERRYSEVDKKTTKNLELVIEVYKRAADRIGRVGEREWREVIEQQRLVLEEVLRLQECIQKNGIPNKNSKSQRAQQVFSSALSEFQLCLTRALDNVVCKDNITASEPYLRTTNTFTGITDQMRSASVIDSLSDAHLTTQPGMIKEKIVCQFKIFHDEFHQRPLSKFCQDLLNIMIGNGPEQTVAITISDMKHYSTTILKNLRDELAFAQQTYIEKLNNDMDNYEMNNREQDGLVLKMSKTELHTLVKQQAQAVMRLRANEATVHRMCHQMKIFMDLMPLCSFQASLSQICQKIFEQEWLNNREQHQRLGNHGAMRNEVHLKVNRIIQELLDTIKREVKASIGYQGSKTNLDATSVIGGSMNEVTEPIRHLLQAQFSNLMAENAVIANLA